ncbi:MAG TPA: pyrroline-5-carboxylate reductase, partial [Coleofasciculaceae cyanobacterium]
MTDSAVQLGFIGGGVMAEAILARLVDRGTIAPGQICVSEPMAERRSFLADRYGIQVTDDNRSLLARAETVMLAIKPQVFPAIAAAVAGAWDPSRSPLVLSILAGTPLSKLEPAFAGCPVVRAMPNTPATVGAGVTAIAPGSLVSAEQVARARSIFGAIGQVVDVPETLMDAVTGLSGSGPAFVALFVEALTDGGVAAG